MLLTIDKAQHFAFAAFALSSFCRDLTRDLKSSFPDECRKFSDTDLELKVSARINDARTVGLCSISSINRFVLVSVTCDWTFEDSPHYLWMTEKYLNRVELGDPDQRMNLLWDQFLYRLEVEDKNDHTREQFEELQDDITPFEPLVPVTEGTAVP